MTQHALLSSYRFLDGLDTSAIFLSTNQIVAFNFCNEQKSISDFSKELNYLQKIK